VDTVTDGNCGADAFIKSALAALPSAAVRREPWADLRKSIAHNKQKAFLTLRKLGADWLKDNATLELWEGFSHADLVCAVSGEAAMASYLSRLRQNGQWLDSAFLHAVGCACKADVLIFQDNMDPTVLGYSLIGEEPCAIVPIALHNDHHFWAMLAEKNVPVAFVDKGDAIKIDPRSGTASRKNEAADQHEDPYVENPLAEIHEAAIQAELNMCTVLASWSPFEEPNEQVIQALAHLANVQKKRMPIDQQLQLRQLAIRHLSEEAAAQQDRANLQPRLN
jgi:hypothetical protein